jgi:hypothetical protein
MNQNILRKSNLRKRTEIRRKVNKQKQDKSNNFHVICKEWLILQYFSPYFYCVTNAGRVVFAYFDLSLLIDMDCKCCFQCENYFLCSRHNILLSNTLSNFSWKLAQIWRRAALNYILIQLNIYTHHVGTIK